MGHDIGICGCAPRGTPAQAPGQYGAPCRNAIKGRALVIKQTDVRAQCIGNGFNYFICWGNGFNRHGAHMR